MSLPKTKAQRGAPLPRNVVKALVTLVQSGGESEALRCLGISKNALIRAMAGLNVLHGTAAAIREGLCTVETARTELARIPES